MPLMPAMLVSIQAVLPERPRLGSSLQCGSRQIVSTRIGITSWCTISMEVDFSLFLSHLISLSCDSKRGNLSAWGST